MASDVQMQGEKPKAVAFEVWFRPVVENARTPNFSPLRGDKNVSKEYLMKKLKEAEIRKKKLTLHSLAKLAAKQQYIQKVRASADQQGKIAEAKLKSKMETYGENKNAIEKALHTRLNAKEERIKDVKAKNQALIDSQCKEIEEKIQNKLVQSEEKTEALRQALKDKLQAHDQKLKEAKNVVQEKVEMHSKITEEKLQKKIKISTEKRQTYIESLKERVHDQNVTAEQKKQIHEEECALIQQLYEEKLQSKMVKYGENRTALLKAKQDQLHAHNCLVKEKCISAKQRKLAQRG
ncbi:cingulin-like [Exaiptasia diaphana]|uniref:Uncharacterized protein n=1 Tax=Exaiptasia diaphana TaxID=2652724 RepID=A0A913WTB6_EXADI|nr:cingulin-like [Exaiptasia diaphana]